MLGQKSGIPKKNASSSKNPDTELTASKHTLVKGPKPLQKLRFYLDVKNHAVTSKLEGKIKELGGVVEFFLDRKVTHVITDRPQCTDNTTTIVSSPSTPRLRSADSVHTNESPVFTCESSTAGRLRQKTRADAMLEKVRTQSAAKVTDPLQNAKLWGIPIWTVNKVFSWLEKISASITVNTSVQKSKKLVKVISIKSPFVKFEPTARNARPVYKTIQSWPVIDLESGVGKPAFVVNNPQTQQKNNVDGENRSRKDKSGGTNGSTMTRKQRTRLSVRGGGKEQEAEKQTLVGGFCEICHCEYREIGEHVRSEQHLNFVKNDANFLELDSLITAGANVEAFLRLNGNAAKDLSNCPLFGRRSLRKLNGKSSPEKCNGTLGDYSPPVTRNKMPRTRNSSNNSLLSQPGSDTVHHLRSRGQLWLPNNLLGTTAEDETPFTKLKDSSTRAEKRNSSKVTGDDETKSAVKDADFEKGRSEGRPKRTCPKTKRVSADERLVADNKTYYKVEVMTTKLRSSGLGTREAEQIRRTQTPIPEETNSEEQSLVVKFKRVRRSELSVLNDEAENFMFPRKDDPSYSDEDTDEAPNTTKSTVKSDTSDLKTSEPEPAVQSKINLEEQTEDSVSCSEPESHPVMRRKRKRNDTKSDQTDFDESNDAISLETCSGENEMSLRRKKRKIYTELDENLDESSKDGSVTCESDAGSKRRKRRTHAEMFIADNQRYYKFETPGSRLRYQGSFFPQAPIKTETPSKNNGESGEVKEITKEDEDKPRMPKDNFKFAFELEPVSEPWHHTFKRQDKGEEFYSATTDPEFFCRFYLPYQLPSFAPLNPQICKNEYYKKKKEFLNTEPSSEASCGSSDRIGESSSPAATGTSETEPGVSTGAHIRRKKRKSRFLILNSNHPRKSPRQHASTLAILSSLIQQRKKRERKSQGDSDASRTSLGTIPDEDQITPTKTPIETRPEDHLTPEERLIQEQISVELSRAIEEILTAPMDDISDLSVEEGIFIKETPDAIDLIENFDNKDAIPEYADVNTPFGTDGVRTVRRKRKKNRTGWPKKKRLFVRRCEQKSEDGNSSLPELEDSRLTEISMEDENRELEMCELDPEETMQMCDSKEILRSKLMELNDGNNAANSGSFVLVTEPPKESTLENAPLECETSDDEDQKGTPLKEKAPKENSSKDASLKEKPSKEETLKEKSSKEETLKEKSSREKSLREKSVREEALKDKSSREEKSASKDKSSKEEAPKEKSSREKVLKEKSSKEESLKEMSVREELLKDKSSREEPLKDKSSHEECLKDKSSKDEALKEKSSTREKPLREKSSREEPLKEKFSKEEALKEKSSLKDKSCKEEKPSREESSKDEAPKEKSSREKLLREKSTREEPLKDKSSKDEEALKEKSSKEEAPKEKSSREKPLREKSVREEALKDKSSKEEALKEKSQREKLPKERTSKMELLKEKSSKDKKKETSSEGEKSPTAALQEEISGECVSGEKATDSVESAAKIKQGVSNCVDRSSSVVEEVDISSSVPDRVKCVLTTNNNSVSGVKVDRDIFRNVKRDEGMEENLCQSERIKGTINAGAEASGAASQVEGGVNVSRTFDEQFSLGKSDAFALADSVNGNVASGEFSVCSGAEEVRQCVNVALDKWENAEKVLHAKVNDNETAVVNNDRFLQYQPFVRVQKIDNSSVALQNVNRRLRSSSSPERKPKAKRARIAPPSPRSPRKLRVPRGKWYRER